VRNYFVKRSFKKVFRIIFLEEKFRLKRNYLKMTGARQWCDWADALEKNRSRHWVGVEGETR
jgi:hypothetical protein